MAVENKSNCFECTGYTKDCPTYWHFEDNYVCVWRLVANENLKKINAGRKEDISLHYQFDEEMISEYQKTPKPVL